MASMTSDGGDKLAMTATVADSTNALRKAPKAATLGRYRLEQVLGTGGMGVVHAAFDIDLERRVAIKLLHTDPSPATRARLLREARAMARLDHPNVVTIFEVDSIDGTDFVVMEIVDGGTLSEWLRAAPRSQREILDAFVAAGRGLAAAHAAGMVHRDFKPHNVLRNLRGEVQVSDFGLAREAGAPVEEAEPPHGGGSVRSGTPSPLGNLTATGMVLGTPAYMAPEQWANGTVSPAADQFAFCVALWEGLTGARPFLGTSTDELRTKIYAGPAKLDLAKVPRRLRGVLVRGLDPDPARRFPSMDALLAALVPGRSRLPWLAGGAAALLVAGVVVAVGATRGSSAPAPPVPPAPPATPDEPHVFVPKNHADLIASIQKIDDTHFSVPRATVDQILLERTEFRDGGRAVPVTADEQMVGWKLFAIRPRSAFAALGLRDLDMVRAIDDVPLTTDASVLAAFKRAHTASSLTIEVERAKQPIRITVAITP